MTTGLTTPISNLTVSLNNGRGTPTTNQTIIHISMIGKSDGDTIYTVPTGKTFYVTGLVISCDADSKFSGIKDATNNYCYHPGYTSVAAGLRLPVVFSGEIIVAFPASTVIKVSTTATGADINVSIWGWIQ
jgi:hypothetical protein